MFNPGDECVYVPDAVPTIIAIQDPHFYKVIAHTLVISPRLYLINRDDDFVVCTEGNLVDVDRARLMWPSHMQNYYLSKEQKIRLNILMEQ